MIGRAHRGDLAGAGSILALAAAYLSPALKDGSWFGPYDAAANGTIGHPGSPAVRPTYNRLSGDLINQGIPWNLLDRTAIHAGHLPLWDPYTVLGLPQLFNFESAAFSLPDLVSYAMPLRIAWLAIAFCKLVIAGLGAYVLCRMLATRPLAAAIGGITFMLSGAYANWLGWSLTGVVAFAPWILAGIIAAYRSPRRRYVVGLAVAVMFACFGGFPEMYVLLALAVAAFAAGAVIALVLLRRRPPWRPCGRVAAGLAAGAGLAAPLLLPGAQLLRLSTHAAAAAHESGLTIARLPLVLVPGYDGLPIRGSVTFPGVNFYETVAYLGLIPVSLAVVGVVARRRQAATIAVAALTVASLVATYRVGSFDPAAWLLNGVGLAAVHASRIRLLTGLGVGVLAALGLETVIAGGYRRLLLALSGAGTLLLLALAGFSATDHLTGPLWTARQRSFIWPAATAVVLIAGAAVIAFAATRRGAVLLSVGAVVAVQVASLLFTGVGLNSYSETGFVQYPAVTELQHLVGAGVVGLDGSVSGTPRVWQRLGFYPNLNAAYRVAQFTAHDPILPATYARAFPSSGRSGSGKALTSLDMPDISTAAEARANGIRYLLVQPGRRIPVGTNVVARIDGEALAQVGGASRAWVVEDGVRLPIRGSLVSTGNGSWRVHLRAAARPGGVIGGPGERLVVALTDVPGMRVTAQGSTLPVTPYDHYEISVRLPAGTTSLTIRYWPATFTDGLAVAGFVLIVLVGWCAVGGRRPRRPRQVGTEP